MISSWEAYAEIITSSKLIETWTFKELH